MAANEPQDIEPLGGAPLAAPDYPHLAVALVARGLAALSGRFSLAGAYAAAARGFAAACGAGATTGAAALEAGALVAASGRLRLRFKPRFDPVPRYTAVLSGLSYIAVRPLSPYLATAADLPYVAIIPGNAMPAIKDLPPIAPNQVQTITCDFGFFLPAGVTLTGTPTINVSDIRGVDAAPSHILNGIAGVGTAPNPPGSGAANAAVLQQVKNGVSGAVYLIEVVCTRSDGDVAEGYFHLPCQAPQ